MNEIMIDLQGGAKAPLYEKIYEYIKNEIVDGKISRGEKLPSTRLLAKNLSVSRSTVELAYDQLLAEGYIEAEPYRGYFVCDIEALYQLEQRNHIQEKLQAGQSWQPGWKTEIKHGAGSSKQKEIDFSPYTIDTQNFPYNVWRKLHKNVLLDDREEILLSGDGQGDYELRVAIADYLHQARGVNCVAEQIIIGAGNEYLELLLTQVLGEKKTVLMDDPTYLQAYRTFSNMGYLVKNIPAEQGSMPIEAVRRENADVLYVMPSHQFPLGTVMPLKQRLELLKWASEKEGRYLIEDDHDSEYRYKGKPIPSLQSIDHEEKVIYLGTFSKSIAPSLRISYMVLPQHLLKNYQNFCGFYSTTVSKIQQEVLREFISGGYFGRHLNKMRGIYKNKHDFLVSELKKRPWVENIAGDNAGLHVLVQVDTQMSEEELCERAAKQGIHLMGISEHYIHKPPVSKPVILLGYGKPDEKKILEGLNRLEQIILK
ncbi:MAG: PLP-dependent aminotransferase family protein [Roseburia inulinivorans]|nr:PLP-dependent aminotransferase family protein [Roseburia inulinivorans]